MRQALVLGDGNMTLQASLFLLHSYFVHQGSLPAGRRRLPISAPRETIVKLSSVIANGHFERNQFITQWHVRRLLQRGQLLQDQPAVARLDTHRAEVGLRDLQQGFPDVPPVPDELPAPETAVLER